MGIEESSVARQLYNSVPAPVQSGAVTLLGLNIRRKRYNKRFNKLSNEYINRQWNCKDDWVAHQNKKLEQTLSIARKSTSHYSDYPEIALDYSKLPSTQIKELPFISSDIIKNNPDSLISDDVKKRACVALSTSGTTGTPKTTYHDPDSQRKYWAAMNRFYHRGGCRYGDRRLSFTGNKVVPLGQDEGPFGRYDKANNRMLMSSYHLGTKTVGEYLDEIESFSPDFIDGYPSAIRFCAKHAIQKGRDIRIPACFPTAETLRNEDREIIERGFSTRVYNLYGSTESAAMITECPCGELHVNPDIGVVELLDEDGTSVSNGEIGELVLTSLNNRAMPLIRYKIGDLARGPLQYKECSCGWNTPVVEEIIGRQDEVVITADGRRVPMLSYNVFKYAEHVEESQIIQENIDTFTIRIVPGSNYSDEQGDLIVERLKERVGTDVCVEIELMDEIQKTESGKFRAVISKIR